MIEIKSIYLYGITLMLVFSVSFCLPPHQRRLSDQEYNEIVEQENKNTENGSSPLDQLGIEYTRYLQQVIDALENDESFKKKLESAQETDIRTAKIAEELEYVNHHVRSKLDELKRTELQRLRELAKQAYGGEHDVHLRPPGHLDHENPNTFEVKDLKKLIHKVTEDLEEADKKRKQMFKSYEMQKHFEREQKLQNMTEEERKKFLQEEEEMKRREQDAKKKVHHPGSKQQLEEVWEEQDHMNKNDFNPKTFFVMHDVDGNGFLDEDEVKTLFLKELDKLYSQGMPHADLMERAEEMERMREHVFNEVDKNRDRLISWEEFYAMSLKPEFNEDAGWQPLDDQQIYTQEELHAFEQQRLAEIEQLRKAGKLPNDPRISHNQMNNNPNIQYNPDAYSQQIYHHQSAGVEPQHGNLNYPHPVPGHLEQSGKQQQQLVVEQAQASIHQQQADTHRQHVPQPQGVPHQQPKLMSETNQIHQNAPLQYNVDANQVPVAVNKPSVNTLYNANDPAAHAKISERSGQFERKS